MRKYISYDYLCSKKDTFPYSYRVLYMQILDSAPEKDDDVYWNGFHDGYELGIAESIDGGKHNEV